jgi:hypothetical protein
VIVMRCLPFGGRADMEDHRILHPTDPSAVEIFYP